MQDEENAASDRSAAENSIDDVIFDRNCETITTRIAWKFLDKAELLHKLLATSTRLFPRNAR
jgi:hypothetical protein